MSDVVDRLVAALNAGDVEAFVACYDESATIEDGYDRVRARGHDAMRKLYAAMFERYPELHVEPGHERYVAVYRVTDGAVVRERLLA